MNGICERHNIQFWKEHGGCPLCLTERVAKLEAQVSRLTRGLQEHGHHDIVQDACHPTPIHDPQLCALCRAYPEASINTVGKASGNPSRPIETRLSSWHPV